MSLDKFLTRAAAKHGDKYDYSRVVYTGSKVPVDIRCKKHDHWFKQNPNNHTQGQGCPLCGKERQHAVVAARSDTAATFLKRAREAHGGRYEYVDVPARVAKETKIRVMCPDHGEFIQLAHVHRKGHGCPHCGADKLRTAAKLEPQSVMQEFAKAHPTLEFLTQYRGMHEMLVARCPAHDLTFTRKAMHFRARGCPQCGRERSLRAPRKTGHFQPRNQARLAEARRYVQKWLHTSYTGSLVVDADSYRGRAHKMRAVCPIHGDNPITFSNLLQGAGCRQCAVQAMKGPRVPFTDVNNRVLEQFDGKISLVEATYTGVHDPVVAVCKDHGGFNTTAHAMRTMTFGCPKCVNNRTSRYETQIMDFVQKLGLEAEQSVWSVLPKSPAGGAQEIDIWVPERGVGIELHGLHFHAQTEDNPRRRHREKWEAAQQIDIQLVQIFQDEWVYRRDAVENRLRAILGVAPRRYARKMTVETQSGVDCEAVSFLERWHTQGAGRRAAMYYVLRYEGEVFAAMSAHRVMGSDTRWEISRFASRGVVVGGFSRLLQAFIRAVRPSEILSYCDLRYGDGHGYEALGFEYERTTDPDWWWLPSKNTKKRVGRQVSQAKKIHRTPELEVVRQANPAIDGDTVALVAGWRRIYGVGSHLYRLRIDTPSA